MKSLVRVREIHGEKIAELFKNFTPSEKKLYGKICNSTDPLLYMDAILETLEINGIEVSDSFIELWNLILEYL